MSKSNGKINGSGLAHGMGDIIYNCVMECVIEILKQAKMMYLPHYRGALWEDQFREKCEERNLTVTKDLSGRHDMEVNGYRVQCKITDYVPKTSGDAPRRVKIGTMRSIKANGGRYGYTIDDHDVVALLTGDQIYLIPADQIKNPQRPEFFKGSIRVEDYKHCIDAWSVFDGENPLPQGRLFT